MFVIQPHKNMKYIYVVLVLSLSFSDRTEGIIHSCVFSHFSLTLFFVFAAFSVLVFQRFTSVSLHLLARDLEVQSTETDSLPHLLLIREPPGISGGKDFSLVLITHNINRQQEE